MSAENKVIRVLQNKTTRKCVFFLMIISETNKMSAKNNGSGPYVANERNKTAYMRNLHISPNDTLQSTV